MQYHKFRLRVFSLIMLLAFSLSFATVAHAASDSGTITGLTANAAGLTTTWTASNNRLASNVNGSNASVNGLTGITITAAAYDGFLSDYDTVVKVKLANNDASKRTMQLEFASTLSPTVGSGVTTVSSTSPYHYELDYGEYVEVSYTNSSTKHESRYVTDIKFYYAANANITFSVVDEALGHYSINGTQVSTATTLSFNDIGTVSVSAASGYKFVGWKTADGTFLEKNKTTNFLDVRPESDVSIYPYFVAADAPKFQVGSSIFFYWQEACDAAFSGGNTIILIENGTLANREERNVTGKYAENKGTTDVPQMAYTLPAGVKFLVPYDSSDPGFFADSSDVLIQEAFNISTAASGAYKTLTIENGTELVVNGYMSVGGKQAAPGSGTTGFVSGTYGHVSLNGSDAKITVNGTLVAFGYITGDGIVHAQSSASVHEFFQINDWRGGTATSSWLTGDYTSFAVSEYFVQNIECRYRIDCGAVSYAHAAITATVITKVETAESRAEYIGPNGLFRLGESGYVVREYVASKDRVFYDLYGNVTTSAIDLSIYSYQMNTGEYIMGLTHGMTIRIKGTDENGNVLNSYADISEDFKLLPGAEIFIEENATLDISESATLYLYDLADWKDSYLYLGSLNSTTVKSVKYTPSTKGTRSAIKSALLQVEGTLIGNSNIFVTNNGGMSADRVIVGTATGKFINNAAASGYKKVELIEMVNNNSEESVSSTAAVGLLAGISDGTDDVNDSFGVGEYQTVSISETTYWYINSAEVEPTCGADGYMKYWCDDANSYLSVPSGKTATGNHSYSSVVTAPTCTEQGYTTHTCTVCSHSYIDNYTSTVSHNYSSVVTAPTCSAQGYTTYTCTACGHSYVGDYTNTVSHNYSSVVTAPTCTDKGYTTHTCSACGDTYKDTYTEAKGHTPGAAATCTTAQTCTVCGDVIVAALGHTPGAAATCTTAQTCTVCGTQLSAALGHSWTDATCTAPKTCSVCGETEGEALGHSWTNATCTAPKTCSVCKVTEGEALGHDYKATVTAPTCTEPGYTTHTCSVCGDTYTADEVAATGHSYGDWIVDTAATCTTAGSKHQECANCGDKVTEEIAALGHDLKDVAGQAATCTEAGYTAYKDCSRCDHIEGKEVVSATGHNHDTVVTAPTCTEAGYTTYTCSVCGDTYTADEVAATGHSYGDWIVDTAATCTTAGSKHQECANCGDKVTEEIAALGHDLKDVAGQAATCTEAGYTAYKDCSRCDHIEGKEVVSATGHNHDTVVTAPTCTEDGYTTYTCHCGDSYVDDEVAALGHTWSAATCTAPKTCSVCGATEGEAAGHSYEAVVTAPTCTEQGYTTYTCHCGDSYVDDEVAALGHTWSAATCTAPKTCSVCGETEGEALGHSWTDATCTTAKTCSVCGETEGEALGHSWTDATCTAPKTCSVCGETEGEALGHSWTDATCTAPKTCSVCKATEGDPLGHDYKATVTAPTCTAKGYTTYTCACGDTYVADEVAALGHTWSAATCTAPKTCSVCGATEGEAAGHSYEAVVTAPTCTEQGYTTHTCTACGDSYKDSYEDALGHTWSAATCTAPKTCSVCGATEGEAACHSYEAVVTAPTCTEAGYTTYTCSACGNTYTADEVAATGHSYGDWIVDTAATCTTAGSKHQKCANCGDKVTEEIAALGHDLKDVAGQAATCTEAGYTAYKDCSRCDHIDGKEVIPATGHVNTTTTTVGATCTTPGSVTVTCACGEVVSTETIPAKGHTPGEPKKENDVASTWDKIGGYDMVVRCEDCGTVLSSEHHNALLNPFYNQSMVLDNRLTVSFNIKKDTLDANLLAEESYYAIVTRIDANGTVYETTIPMSEWIAHSKNRMRIEFDNLNARNMADRLQIVIYNSAGEQVSVALVTSVVELAMDEIEWAMTQPAEREYLTMMVDMLNYGAAAQKYFKYDVANLANKYLTEDQKKYATDDAVHSSKYDNTGFEAYQSTNVELESNIVMNMVFYKDTFGTDLNNIVAKVTYSHHRGNAVEKTINGSEFGHWSKKGTRERFCITIDDLVIADGNQVVTVEFFDLDGNSLGKVSNSIVAEVGDWLVDDPDEELYSATIKFMNSAYAYFH